MAKKSRNQDQTTFANLQSGGTTISYSGDKPNPELRNFIKQCGTAYDPETDDYRVSAFCQPITSTKATAIYLVHSYHQGKKPHDAIRQYIRHYTEKGDLVFDPFSGSGGTSLAALLERRVAVATDRSPASTFITKNYCTTIEPSQLRSAFERIQQAVSKESQYLYGTVCDRCNGAATVNYTVYSQVFQCPRCLKKVALFDCPTAQGHTVAGKPKSIHICPHCHEKGHTEEISTSSESFGHVPVLQCYQCENGCKPPRTERSHQDADKKKRASFEKHDLGKLMALEEEVIPYWYPTHRMMNVESDTASWGVKWRAGTSNFRTVAELFTKRNLWALAALRDAIVRHGGDQKDALLFAVNAITLNCSRMYQYRVSLKGGFQKGTYYIPQESQIINVFRAFRDKVEDVCRAAAEMPDEGCGIISTQSCCDLGAIPSNAVDYIFTDPPYSDNVQYGELNFIWEAWLDFDTHWHDEEIIVNDVRGRTEAEWAAMMKEGDGRVLRVLKPGRWLSSMLSRHVRGNLGIGSRHHGRSWFCRDKTDSALFIDTGQKSYNQLTADKSTKRDLVLNFRKPKPMPLGIAKVYGPEDAERLPRMVTSLPLQTSLVRLFGISSLVIQGQPRTESTMSWSVGSLLHAAWKPTTSTLS